jgi:DNA polymerase V
MYSPLSLTLETFAKELCRLLGVPKLPLFIARASVQAGFPSPALDHAMVRIELEKVLVPDPDTTFLLRVAGESMVQAGIHDGDVAVVNKAIRARHGHLVVAVIDGEITLKKLFRRAGVVKLCAANPDFPDIVLKDAQSLEIWGVVTSTVRQHAT